MTIKITMMKKSSNNENNNNNVNDDEDDNNDNACYEGDNCIFVSSNDSYQI